MVESEEGCLASNVDQDASRRWKSAIVSPDAASGGKRHRRARRIAVSVQAGTIAASPAKQR
ncbi:hypothetical protein [Burkholderia sp. FL-7-2-10-S1-D7]|uniref:hypothetical protein n=1 Tax=Burkholderia sp. FL-7-2-10-S1-D7 TaxID=1637866 RepID=UPI000AC80622|nr:hypothetical protein [Burkholderia sp. FL-7-2-10-S1-D7]